MEFTSLTVDTAPEPARRLVAASEKQFGFLPSPVARAARSPELLQHLFASFAAYDKSSLSPLEREVVALTVAFENECHYCMALHSATLAKADVPPAVLEALRAGTELPVPRLEALRTFARAVLLGRGRVPEDVRLAFERAGFDERHALDVVLGVGVYVLSTLSNILTEAPLDPAFEPFRWSKPPAP